MTEKESLVPAERIDQAILVIRGKRVILDPQISAMYGVAVKRLNQAVSRNLARFPEDFMFQLTEREIANLRSHFVTSSSAEGTWGGRRYRPRAFTEHGVVMLSSVLRSTRAVQVNLEVVRAFVRLRRSVQTHRLPLPGEASSASGNTSTWRMIGGSCSIDAVPGSIDARATASTG